MWIIYRLRKFVMRHSTKDGEATGPDHMADHTPRRVQTWVLTMLPVNDDPCSKLLWRFCRKVVREVEPVDPPRALTRLLKLVCRVLSALLVELA